MKTQDFLLFEPILHYCLNCQKKKERNVGDHHVTG